MPPSKHRVCPVQHAGALTFSLRRIIHNPRQILAAIRQPWNDRAGFWGRAGVFYAGNGEISRGVRPSHCRRPAGRHAGQITAKNSGYRSREHYHSAPDRSGQNQPSGKGRLCCCSSMSYMNFRIKPLFFKNSKPVYSPAAKSSSSSRSGTYPLGSSKIPSICSGMRGSKSFLAQKSSSAGPPWPEPTRRLFNSPTPAPEDLVPKLPLGNAIFCEALASPP